ncbi:hypothetical protein AB0L57_10815 [Nocardia sp. NPDC052254]|jgi:hypothetical protein|uniref:hypothetical protein n=1 Tax=Nocardia sp. NPDC052254 TaxID=3155681 RepID=UPI00341B077F
MSAQGTWEDLVTDLCDLAVRHDATTFLYESVVVLSSHSARLDNGAAASIRVTRFDDEAARVEAGWCLDMVVDYVTDDATRPCPALALVDAICAGDAEEHSLIGADGRWIGIYCHAWGPTGAWRLGNPDAAPNRAIRRFPRWLGAKID